MTYSASRKALFFAVLLSAGSVSAQTFTRVQTGAIVNDGGTSFGHSWGDFDGDGWLDLLVNNIVRAERNFFYRNLGDGTFECSSLVSAPGPSTSSTWGDFNNDGLIDFFVSNGGTGGSARNFLFANAGEGAFQAVTSGSHVQESNSHTASTWLDANNDGWLDLFVGRSGASNRLFMNQGDATFVARNLPDVGGTWGVSATDIDGDGDLDFYGANWGIDNYFYRNDGQGNFSKISGPILGRGERSVSASWGDVDNDGDSDLFVANVGARNRLYLNAGDGFFSEVTTGAMVTEVEDSESSCFGDLDNDGDLDLILSGGGNVSVGINNIYVNDGSGVFEKRTDGAIVNTSGRYEGLSCVDYDNDGDLDVFISNYNGLNNVLYRNDGPAGAWITFRTVGVQSNRTGIGARVRTLTQINGGPVWQVREVSGQTGHVAQGDQRPHFGLGSATSVDSVVVEWPSGQVDSYSDVAAGQIVVVTEGVGLTGVSVGVESPEAGTGFRLAAYPNPFKDAATLEFELDHPAAIQIQVVDLLGRQLVSVAEHLYDAGTHRVEIDAESMPSGPVFYRVSGDTVGQSQGLLILQK